MTARLDLDTVVYTDLDGTLLDHDDYSYEPAIEALNRLESLNIPVVINTSKTFAEVEDLQQELIRHNNLIARMPVIVENGAAVFIPKDPCYGELDLPVLNGFWCKPFGPARAHIRGFIASYLSQFADDFELFGTMGAEGISAATGLNLVDSERANQREFSEPMLWRGSDSTKAELVSIVAKHGMTVLEGGRFLHITSGYDKGQAMLWANQFLSGQSNGKLPLIIALGDSGNDIAMLNAADHPVVIKKADGKHIALDKSKAETLFTKQKGPAGWAEAINILKPMSAKGR